MRDYFIRLFEFDEWANRQVLSSIKSCPAVPSKAVEWLGHLLVSQLFVWEVVNGWDGSYLQERPDPALDECEQLITDLGEKWYQYFQARGELAVTEKIHFKNSRGEQVTRRVTDLLTHAVNHATYHRGQIAREVRAAGGEPARIDIPVWAAGKGK